MAKKKVLKYSYLKKFLNNNFFFKKEKKACRH